MTYWEALKLSIWPALDSTADTLVYIWAFYSLVKWARSWWKRLDEDEDEDFDPLEEARCLSGTGEPRPISHTIPELNHPYPSHYNIGALGMRESKIRAKIVKELKNRGARPVKYYGCVYTEAGVSDLLVCYRGLFLVIETKVPGEVPTVKQKAFIASVHQSEGWGGPASSVEEALAYLDEIDSTMGRLGTTREILSRGRYCDPDENNT